MGKAQTTAARPRWRTAPSTATPPSQGAGFGTGHRSTLIVAASSINNNHGPRSAGGGVATSLGGTATITNSVINANRVISSVTALGGRIDCENSLLSLKLAAHGQRQSGPNGATAAWAAGSMLSIAAVNVKNSTVQRQQRRRAPWTGRGRRDL